jgi:hypothetical protein
MTLVLLQQVRFYSMCKQKNIHLKLETMKRSVKLAVLFVLVNTGLFAAIPAKPISLDPPSKDMITFHPLPSQAGVDVQVEKKTPGKVVVIIFDEYANVYLKEILSAEEYMKRDYILTKLGNGDYTIEVTSNKKVMKKDFRVYDGQCYML